MRKILIFVLLKIIVSGIEQQSLDLYHNDEEIQSITDDLLRNPMYSKRACEIDDSYKIMEIGNKQASLSALITCNIHARQLITSQLCLLFMKTLENKPEITNHMNFRVFYRGNNQRQKVLQTKNFTIRTNVNNVDLNRNFPSGFQGQNPSKQTNSGPFPLSQKFSQCVDYQVKNNKPTTYLDVHSGQFSIYEPNIQSQKNSRIINEIQQKICANCFIRKTAPNGSIYSDLNIRYGIQYSNLIEIYGGINANLQLNDQVFSIFNPLSKRILDFYLERFNNAMLYYFERIIDIEGK